MTAMMLWGTSSNAGKTTVSAGICRYLSREGRSVAPYKASNLSLNSCVTSSGAEIGIGQAVQAWACGLEPEGDMNPILLKPAGKGVIQYIINGHVYTDGIPSFDKRMKVACEAFDRMSQRYDDIICEGSGSPASLRGTASYRAASTYGASARMSTPRLAVSHRSMALSSVSRNVSMFR